MTTIPQYAGLTDRQCHVVEVIRQYVAEHGWAPSMEDIGRGLKVTRQCVSLHLIALQSKGVIVRDLYAVRSIRIVEERLTPVASAPGYRVRRTYETQREAAAGKRLSILTLLAAGSHTTKQIAAHLGTSGPGALYLLRQLEGQRRVVADRGPHRRHWAWSLALSESDVEGMP